MSIRYNEEIIAGKYKSQTIYPASENEAGIIQIASSQDVKDGTNNTKAVTPRRLRVNHYNKTETDNMMAEKQNILIAGENITIEDNTISAIGGGAKITFRKWGVQ